MHIGHDLLIKGFLKKKLNKFVSYDFNRMFVLWNLR